MQEYPKIPSPFNRATEGENRNKLIIGDWVKPEFEELRNLQWIWTEKVDGTNLRVHYDGHKVYFGGRTDNAQIPAKLVQRLTELFPEELFEQQFNDQPVTLYGEGYGAGIQKGGGNYSKTQDFVLFDVRIGNWWLLRDSVVEIAGKLGIDVVPVVLEGTMPEAIDLVRSGVVSAWGSSDGRGSFSAEGLVGVTALGLLGCDGKRLQVKVKTKDFSSG